MANNKTIALSLIILASGLIIFLLLVPRTPKLSEAQLSKSPLDLKVEKAITLVQTSGAPMQGISLLKEVLEEDPEHKEAIWQLGMFSMQSGQYQKAIERFTSLIDIVGNESKKENIGPYFQLLQAYIATENYPEALLVLQKLEVLVDDETLRQEIKDKQNELNNILKDN